MISGSFEVQLLAATSQEPESENYSTPSAENYREEVGAEEKSRGLKQGEQLPGCADVMVH